MPYPYKIYLTFFFVAGVMYLSSLIIKEVKPVVKNYHNVGICTTEIVESTELGMVLETKYIFGKNATIVKTDNGDYYIRGQHHMFYGDVVSLTIDRNNSRWITSNTSEDKFKIIQVK